MNNRIGDNLICTGANERIVRAFLANNVEFLIVGGLAVSWYCETRQADDMDVLVNPTPDNSERLSFALSMLNVPIETQAFSELGKQLPLKTEFYADIISPAVNGIPYDEASSNITNAKCFNLPVFLPSLVNLIRLKEEAAQRSGGEAEKHLRDIALLRQCFHSVKNN